MWTPQSGKAWFIALVGFALLVGCSDDSRPDDELKPARAEQIPEVVPASDVLAGAHIPKLDPEKLEDAEIRKALGADPQCQFRYTSFSKPVLATGPATAEEGAGGVVKLNGELVVLRPVSSDSGAMLAAEGIRMTVRPLNAQNGGSTAGGEQQEAEAVFEIRNSLRVGYRGYYSCVE